MVPMAMNWPQMTPCSEEGCKVIFECFGEFSNKSANLLLNPLLMKRQEIMFKRISKLQVEWIKKELVFNNDLQNFWSESIGGTNFIALLLSIGGVPSTHFGKISIFCL
jgi:hypothetical protein